MNSAPSEPKFLSCAEAAKLMGVSRSTVQRYCDQGVLKPHKTLGGHRRVSSEDVTHWLKSNRSTKRYRKSNTEFRASRYTPTYIADALLSGNLKRLELLIDQVLSGNQKVHWLFDRFFAPAMWEIGDRWANKEIDFPEERRATSNLKILLRGLSRSFQASPCTGVAVGATLEGDHSEIGSMMIELLLREANFDAFHIGTNLPPETLADISSQMNATLVWVSYSHVVCRVTTEKQNHLLVDSLEDDTQLVIGGYAIDSDLQSRLKYDFYGQNLTDFTRFVTEQF